MGKTKWSAVIPTKPGKYWFHGSLYGEDKIGLHYMEMWQISNGVTFVRGGAFMYPRKECVGLWTEVILPELPNKGGN